MGKHDEIINLIFKFQIIINKVYLNLDIYLNKGETGGLAGAVNQMLKDYWAAKRANNWQRVDDLTKIIIYMHPYFITEKLSGTIDDYHWIDDLYKTYEVTMKDIEKSVKSS